MSVLLNTPINRYAFLCELYRLVFGTHGETSLTFAISKGEDVVFSNTYYPDASGKVVIYDIDKVLEHRLDKDDLLSNQFYFTANGASLVNTTEADAYAVILPSIAVNEPAVDYISAFFLSTMAQERDTAIGRYETITALTPTATAPTIEATYYDSQNVELLTATITLPAVSGNTPLNVSPERFVDDTKGRLVAYEVRVGGRKAKYRVLPSLPEADPAVMFRNSFGQWETFYLTGAKTQEPEFTRSSAMISGRYTTYNIEETMKWTASTGPLRYGMVAVANDLARSRAVYLLNADGTPGDEIVITDCDLKADNADTLPNLQFTYRLASRQTAKYNAVRPPRLFDSTFDATFE